MLALPVVESPLSLTTVEEAQAMTKEAETAMAEKAPVASLNRPRKGQNRPKVSRGLINRGKKPGVH
jgi:hypothetical protein